MSGLEWNVRASSARNPAVVEKIAAVFESYWSGGDFVAYDPEEFAALTQSETTGPEILLSPIELRPEPFQERLLEQIAQSRELDRRTAEAGGAGLTVPVPDS